MAFQSSLLSKSYEFQTIKKQSLSTPNTYGISLMMAVEDEEPIIEIDSDSRKITIPDELFNIGVTGDHNCETVYFRISRFFDGVDLSAHDCIIRFLNAAHEYGEEEVCNVEISDDYIKFGWLIDKRVTRYSGKIEFTVQFETIDNYQWQTVPANLNILQGIDEKNIVVDKDDSLFRALSKQVDDIKNRLDYVETEASKISDIEKQVDTLDDNVNYLKNNVVYVLND